MPLKKRPNRQQGKRSRGQKPTMPRSKKKGANSKISYEESSGNVFVDLGYAEAEAVNIVARLELMAQIEDIIKARGWTQLQAATAIGIAQPRVSALMASHSEKFTVDMLMKLLYKLGKKVKLSVTDREV